MKLYDAIFETKLRCLYMCDETGVKFYNLANIIYLIFRVAPKGIAGTRVLTQPKITLQGQNMTIFKYKKEQINTRTHSQT